MNSDSQRDLVIINVAGFLRSVGTGFIGVVLGVYLFRIGLSSFRIGLVIAAGLAGSALATVIVSLAADWLGRRKCLFIFSLLSMLGGVALAFVPGFPVLISLAFISMLNGTGTDRSASFALEQAIIPALAPDAKRTWNLAWYNVLLDGGGSLGALAAAVPLILQHRLTLAFSEAYRLVFLSYSALFLLVAVLYLFLSSATEIPSSSLLGNRERRIPPETRRTLGKLTALFSLDAFGGGFLIDALVAYWFFRRFGVAESELGYLFFTVRALNACSHLGAAWLARRIGLVNTMVFTHLPSSVFLMAVPFAPSLKWAVALFLCREALVEMDVPTRQSYVAAMVRPTERSFASGITNLARNIFWGVGSATAGLLMQNLAFAAPLWVGGGTKVTYDVLLYRSFRNLKTPEEHHQAEHSEKPAP